LAILLHRNAPTDLGTNDGIDGCVPKTLKINQKEHLRKCTCHIVDTALAFAQSNILCTNVLAGCRSKSGCHDLIALRGAYEEVVAGTYRSHSFGSGNDWPLLELSVRLKRLAWGSKAGNASKRQMEQQPGTGTFS